MKQILLALIINGVGIAYGENTKFHQANQYYKEGKYEQAISLYQQIIDSGIKNGVIFYNLGNAYLKNGQLGKSILSYERAKRFLPRDEDINSNLAYANLLTIDKISKKRHWLKAGIIKAHQLLNINEQTLVIFIIYLIITLLIILYIFINKRLFIITGIILVSVFLILLISLSLKIHSTLQQKEVIMIVPRVEVKSGAEDKIETIFFIHEGTKVKINEVRDNWYCIELLDGKIGWIKNDTVERIYSTY